MDFLKYHWTTTSGNIGKHESQADNSIVVNELQNDMIKLQSRIEAYSL